MLRSLVGSEMCIRDRIKEIMVAVHGCSGRRVDTDTHDIRDTGRDTHTARRRRPSFQRVKFIVKHRDRTTRAALHDAASTFAHFDTCTSVIKHSRLVSMQARATSEVLESLGCVRVDSCRTSLYSAQHHLGGLATNNKKAQAPARRFSFAVKSTTSTKKRDTA